MVLQQYKSLKNYPMTPENFDGPTSTDVEGEHDVVAIDVVIVKHDGLFVNQDLVDVNGQTQAIFPRMLVQLLGNHVPNQDDPFGPVTTGKYKKIKLQVILI